MVNAKLRQGDQGVVASLVSQGLIPCAPYTPSVAITTRTLDLYKNTHLRCPHLAVQPFVKALCDLHGVSRAFLPPNLVVNRHIQFAFRPYLSQQFSICYDLYLAIQSTVRARVHKALGRDSAHWRIKNTCPACTYKIHSEAELSYKILLTMDGNDSLKRFLL